MKVYIASKTRHASDWQGYRRIVKSWGVDIISTWIDEAELGEQYWEDLWLRCIGEARSCDILLCYAEPGEILKGALVEVGAALGAGKFVYYVGPKSIGSWLHHPLVFEFPSLGAAFYKIKEVAKSHGTYSGELPIP